MNTTTTTAGREAGQRLVRFTTRHVAHSIRGNMDCLSGLSRIISTGEAAEVLRYGHSRSNRRERMLVRTADGMFAWCDTDLMEVVQP